MPRKAVAPPVNPILVGHLPRAEDDAYATFVRLPGNAYQNASLGKWKAQDEGTACDCHYEPGKSDPRMACGEGSDCINRLTLVECIEGDCPSRAHCRNQRFQRKQYADIGIVQTEKKGFGLRALSDISTDAFIYEYIGEVIKEAEFMRRMHKYAEEGIRHFYFMMLQKDEFIDATKKGDIGRFANHSCNPNCYVSKWFVGKRVRMGIFAKRPIMKDEELTFNYNVDRYGNDAQECYCGEPNCVGYIGGKTQTDIGGMDDLYIDALGITDDVERLGLKGSKKKRGRKLDEDFIPVLTPVQDEEVPNVCNAIRRASVSNQKMLPHLLSRLKMTEDAEVLRGVMRLRGFSLMNQLLDEHEKDPSLVKLILEAMTTWPLINRNKVEDSHIEELVRKYSSVEDEEMRSLAERLLNQWSILPTAYRIPRRAVIIEDEGDDKPIRVIPVGPERPEKRSYMDDVPKDTAPIFKVLLPAMTPPVAATSTPPPPPPALTPSLSTGPSREQLNAIISRATEAAAKAAEEAALAAEEQAKKAAAAAAKPSSSKRPRSSKSNGKSKVRSQEKTQADNTKKLLKLVGAVVVKYMSRYRDDMDHETFKKHAKELTHLITEKEKKGSSFQAGKVADSLSDEKKSKMKKFVHDYIAKVLKRMKAKSSSSSTPALDPRRKSAGGSSTSLSMEIDRPPSVEDDAAQGAEVDDLVAGMLVEEGIDADMEMDSEDDEGPSSSTPQASGSRSTSVSNAPDGTRSASMSTPKPMDELSPPLGMDPRGPPPPDEPIQTIVNQPMSVDNGGGSS